MVSRAFAGKNCLQRIEKHACTHDYVQLAYHAGRHLIVTRKEISTENKQYKTIIDN